MSPDPSRPPGVLKPWQRRLYGLLLIPLGLIAANSIFIAAFTRDTRLLLRDAAPASRAGRAHRRSLLRLRRDPRQTDDPDVEQAREVRGPRHLHAARSSASSTGVFMIFRGATLANRAIWLAHVASVPLALVAFILHRRAHTTSSSSAGSSPGAAPWPCSWRRWPSSPGSRSRRKRIVNVNGDTVFYPSSSETFDQGLLDGKKLAANEYCKELPPRLVPPVGTLRAPLLLVQQPVLPKERRAHGRSGRPRADEVVLGLPRPGRSLHGADGRGDAGRLLLRLLGGAAGADLHVLPLDRRGQGHERQRRLRDRGVEAVSVRLLRQRGAAPRSTGCSSAWSPRSTARRS